MLSPGILSSSKRARHTQLFKQRKWLIRMIRMLKMQYPRTAPTKPGWKLRSMTCQLDRFWVFSCCDLWPDDSLMCSFQPSLFVNTFSHFTQSFKNKLSLIFTALNPVFTHLFHHCSQHTAHCTKHATKLRKMFRWASQPPSDWLGARSSGKV